MATLNVQSGNLQLGGTITGGAINLSGGALVMAANSTYASAFNQTGALVKLNTRTLTLSGATSFGSGAEIDGQGAVVTSGATSVIDPGNGYNNALTLGAAAQWTNSGVASIGGQIGVGDALGLTASFNNTSTGKFNLTSDDASIVNNSINNKSGSSTFVNAGTLAKSGGTGVSHILSSVTDTGIVNVVSGTLEFDAGGNFAGQLTGNGTLAFAGGTNNLLTNTSLSVQNLLIDGGAVNLSGSVSSYAGVLTISSGSLKLGGNLALSGNFYETQGDVLLAAHTLTLSGNSFLGSSTNYHGDQIFIDGSGTLSSTGVVTLADVLGDPEQLTLGGGATWQNSGRVYVGALIGVGDAAGTVGSFVNTSTGVFDLTTDDAGIVNAQIGNLYGSSTFTNAGLLEKTGALGVSYIASSMTDTGTIKVVTGVLEFDGGGSFSGPISGNGVVDFGGGNVTLGAASSLTVGHLEFTGASVALATSFTTYSGTFEQTLGSLKLGVSLTLSGFFSQTQGSINLNGKSLTLSGPAQFGVGPSLERFAGGAIDGAGTLITSGAVRVLDSNLSGPDSIPQLSLGGGVAWTNNGTVSVAGVISVGDTTGIGAAFTNSAGKSFNLIDDDASIVNASFSNNGVNSTGSSTFRNAGTLAKTAGAGTSSIYSVMTDFGTVSAATGTLAFWGGGTFSGSFTGAGAIAFFGGTNTVSLGTLTVGNLLVGGGSVTFTASTYAGNFNETNGYFVLGSNFTDSGQFSFTSGGIYLGTRSLILSGVVNIGQLPSPYSPTGFGELDGPGSWYTSKVVNINDPAFYSGATPNNGGLTQLLLGGGLTWNNTGVVNDAGAIAVGDSAGINANLVNKGTFNFTSDDGDIVNNTFAQSGGQNTVGFSNLTSSGTLAKTGGTGTSHIASNVTDTGTVSVSSGTLEFDGGGSFTGAISGAGQAAFGGGAVSLNSGTQITVAALLFDGATVALPGNFSTYAGTFTQSGGEVDLNSNLTLSGAFTQTGGDISLQGDTLTLAGSTALGYPIPTYNGQGGGEVDGLGSLITNAATTIFDPGYNSGTANGGVGQLFLGGGATWTNNGVVSDGGAIYFGDGAGLTAAFVNSAGGQFDFTSADGAILANNVGGQVGTATFTNAGALVKAAGDGTSLVEAAMTDTGTISVVIGTLEFDNGGSFAGAIGGAGTIQFGGGAAVLASGASLSVGQVLLTGSGTLEVSTSLTYAGVLTATGGAMNIDSGDTFTLSNYGYFSGGGLEGGGTLAISGELNLAGAYLANSAINLLSGGSMVGYGTVGPAVSDAGSIEATGGSLVIGGAVSGTGSLLIDPNAELELQSSASQTVTFNGPGGTLFLDQPTLYSGALSGLGAGDTLVLGNTTALSAAFGNGDINVTLAGNVVEHFAVTGGGAGLSLSAPVVVNGATYLSVGQA